jgi:hypothetical protein
MITERDIIEAVERIKCNSHYTRRSIYKTLIIRLNIKYKKYGAEMRFKRLYKSNQEFRQHIKRILEVRSIT